MKKRTSLRSWFSPNEFFIALFALSRHGGFPYPPPFGGGFCFQLVRVVFRPNNLFQACPRRREPGKNQGRVRRRGDLTWHNEAVMITVTSRTHAPCRGAGLRHPVRIAVRGPCGGSAMLFYVRTALKR